MKGIPFHDLGRRMPCIVVAVRRVRSAMNVQSAGISTCIAMSRLKEWRFIVGVECGEFDDEENRFCLRADPGAGRNGGVMNQFFLLMLFLAGLCFVASMNLWILLPISILLAWALPDGNGSERKRVFL